MSKLFVNEAIAVLQNIIENGGKNTAVSHNIGELEPGCGDNLQELLQNLRECINQLPDQEKKELDTTLFIHFAKKHQFFVNNDVTARHSRKAPLLSFFYQAFKDFTFEGIQIGEFIFL